MIVCAGEALVDMLPRQTEDGSAAFMPVPGGAALNSAMALARLGGPAALLTGLSTDVFGRMLDDTLAGAGADTALCVRSSRPTTLAFVHFVNGEATYQFLDENSAGRSMSVEDLPALPASVSAILFGGISLAQEPCGTAFETLITRHRDHTLTMFDPNIRPALIDDEAAYRARLDRMFASSDIIKLSQEDIRWLGFDGPDEQLVERLLGGSAALVIVTRGEEGCSAYTAGLKMHVPTVSTDVVDTVGAGDTFNAAFLAGMYRYGFLSKAAIREIPSGRLHETLTFANSAAAISVGRAGADSPWAHELDED